MHDVCSSVNGDPSPVTAAANSSLNLLRETDCSCGDAVEVVVLPVVDVSGADPLGVEPLDASAEIVAAPNKKCRGGDNRDGDGGGPKE
jgi:hypothetical protein